MTGMDYEVAAEQAAVLIAEALRQSVCVEDDPDIVRYLAERIGFHLGGKIQHDEFKAFFEVAYQGLGRSYELFGWPAPVM